MIQWKPFSDKAIDFLFNSTARLNILHGSVRSSKTINCTVRWLTYLATGPEGDLAMLGKTTATLQRNVLNDIQDIVGDANFKWINKQQGELLLLGRRVYCFGAHNEESESKLRGATFAGSYCDEVSLYPQSVFNQLMARMSVKGAQCFCNTNPDNPYHWFNKEYIQNEAIQNKKIWHFVMDDNLSLDEEYVESLKQMYTGVWYDRLILGLWVVAEGAVYDMFDRYRHVVDTKKEMSKIGQVYKNVVACDYGTSSVMSWGHYAFYSDGKIFKMREYFYNAVKEGKQKTDGMFGNEFEAWCGRLSPDVVYCDPSAASWKTELMYRGFRVQDAENDVINGIRTVGSSLTTGNYFIDSSCINTIDEYQSYSWDATQQEKGIDKPLKRNDHTCDTDRYAIHTESLYGLTGVYGRR